MNEREKIIRLWFDMWLYQKDMGIDDIFAEDVLYTESWCPQYSNRKTVKHWFQEWNTRGKVVVWEIKQFSIKKSNDCRVVFQNGMWEYHPLYFHTYSSLYPYNQRLYSL